jgi:hypothetical protein
MPDVNTNRVIQNIPLDVQTPGYSALVFLRAEVNGRQYTPFALVYYSISGHERGRALRLDLGKRQFIDPADAEPNDPEFANAARLLASFLSERINAELIKLFTQGAASPF